MWNNEQTEYALVEEVTLEGRRETFTTVVLNGVVTRKAAKFKADPRIFRIISKKINLVGIN